MSFSWNSYKRRKKGTISKLGHSNRCHGWLQKITRNYFTKYDWIFGKFQKFAVCTLVQLGCLRTCLSNLYQCADESSGRIQGDHSVDLSPLCSFLYFYYRRTNQFHGPRISGLNFFPDWILKLCKIIYSTLFARFAWMVTPRNMLLLACHLTNLTLQVNTQVQSYDSFPNPPVFRFPMIKFSNAREKVWLKALAGHI